MKGILYNEEIHLPLTKYYVVAEIGGYVAFMGDECYV
jgi:hypothetical protein